MSSIKARVVEVLELKGIPKESFYQKIGVTSANFRGKAKGTPLNSDAIENILSEINDINPLWLLTGKGEMLLKDAPQQENITENFNLKLDDMTLNRLLTMLESRDRMLEDRDRIIRQKDEEIRQLRAQLDELRGYSSTWKSQDDILFSIFLVCRKYIFYLCPNKGSE